MSVPITVYEILVHNLGEDVAFEMCEKLGGMDLTIPTKAHKTYRVRTLVERHREVFKDEKKRNKFVKLFSERLEISKSVIYKIIREKEND